MFYSLLILIVLIIGLLSGYFIAKIQSRTIISILTHNLTEAHGEKNQLELGLKQQQDAIINYIKQIATYENELENSNLRIVEQKKIIEEVQFKFKGEFENLANRIFEEKSTKFTQQNQTNLSNILTPLNEKIKDFELKVNNVYDKESKERVSLKTQIEELSKLNKQMNEETRNLTKALKGDTKIQGNWGEMILESILQKSGLTKDVEYSLQVTVTQDNQRYRPDVVINLPDNKSLVIDSKVSLTAYERYVATVDNQEYNLKEHIQSIKTHIKGLSNKNYQNLYGVNSVDFVLMFIPIEVAYLLALEHDNAIIDEALIKNIIIVCPSTLLATLRTVYSIWRTEKSLQNSHEIARIGGELYDRFVGFLDALTKIKKSMEQTQVGYDDAITKLQGNKGIFKSVEKLKELGASTQKIIKKEWQE